MWVCVCVPGMSAFVCKCTCVCIMKTAVSHWMDRRWWLQSQLLFPRGFRFQLTSCGGTGSWLHCVEKRGRAAFSPASSGFPNSAFIRVFGFLHNALHGRYISPRLPRHSISAGTSYQQRCWEICFRFWFRLTIVLMIVLVIWSKP